MKNRTQFTVSIHGRGNLLGMVVVDGLKAFPKSTWYDYSDQMKEAIALEASIANSGRMDPRFVPSVRRATKNQRSHRKTDVCLYFTYTGNIERTRIVVGKRTRVITFDPAKSTHPNPYDDASQKVLKAIGQML